MTNQHDPQFEALLARVLSTLRESQRHSEVGVQRAFAAQTLVALATLTLVIDALGLSVDEIEARFESINKKLKPLSVLGFGADETMGAAKFVLNVLRDHATPKAAGEESKPKLSVIAGGREPSN